MSQLSLTDGQKIILNKHDSIGVNEALDDKEYLFNCFIDLGDLEQIKSFSNKKCLLLGRTGAGKSALVTKLQEEKPEKVIVINPESLAMRHISNSTIIQYLLDLGIDLNTFFKLLWRHEICVEIFTRHMKITSDTDRENYIEQIKYRFKKKNVKHLNALNYLLEWKDTFWKTNDNHVSKMITKTEDEISASVGVSSDVIRARIGGNDKFTQEEVREIKQYGQSIVNDVQMQEVMGLLDMLDDFIEFHQAQYYIVIDRLDEKWVGNKIRYKLIKALIETARDLNRLNNIKPIATLRYDLLGRVFDISNDTGFQEEKYKPLYLDVKWSKAQLIELVNTRINYQFRSRYSKKKQLTYLDIFPETIKGVPTIDFLIERTLMRPRDIIEFVNYCISFATDDGDGVVTEDIVLSAEAAYSKDRLESLYYEWSADYPGLKELVKLIKKQRGHFNFSEISVEHAKDVCLRYAANPPETDIDTKDSILRLATDVTEGRMDAEEFLKHLVVIFHRVGLVGVKESDSSKIQWNRFIAPKLDWDDIDSDTVIYVHLCYQRALKVEQGGNY